MTPNERELEETTLKIVRWRIVNFPKIADARGNLSFIEENSHVPFDIKRVYYLYDVPSGATRGGHAHKKMEQVIIALSGSFDVTLDDGYHRETFFLNRPHYGLYIPPSVWREMKNFSSNSIALVLASTLYDEKDYIRDYETFKKSAEKGE
jgi:dTDP-4-dehydrorhamnose 3,5-epimerase-like enzyme